LALGVIQLGRQAMRNRPWTFATIACIAGALSIAGSVASLHMGRTLKRMRGLASACLEVERYIDPATDRYPQSCLFPLFPMTPGTSWVRPSAEVLGQLGFRKIATHAIFVPNPPVSYGSFETAAGVGGTPTVHNDSAIRANGWIISRVNSASPPLVLISVDQAHMFVAAALAGLRNSATALRGGETVKLWSVKVPAVFLPHGMSVLHAWLYRADAEEFDQLTNVDGEHRVDRTP
ncbi:MAG TPA: hypothetical protein VJ728_02385, partial [Candidatus Binataceae bacterium]|nr:hypothetical protein [Candidatus Binataceae bacterium]